MEEGRGPRVPRSKGSKVHGSQGPRYLKLKFKYELDSKVGPSCFHYIDSHSIYNLLVKIGLLCVLNIKEQLEEKLVQNMV